MSDTPDSSMLPGTGERFLPEFKGDIVAEHYHRYLLAARFVEGKRVLDIASGEGYGSYRLAARAERVTGVDIDRDSVRHASEHYQRDNLEFRQGDCTAIPLPDASVDVVVSFETIEHHDKHQEMLQEIKRVLRPDGLLIISSPDKREYSDVPGYENPYHVKELYQDEFESLLTRHFRQHHLVGQRVLFGSAIVDPTPSALETFRALAPGAIEDTSSDTPLEKSEYRPMYWVALASDAELPACGSSFFYQDIINSDAVQQREQQLNEAAQEIENRDTAIEERDQRLQRFSDENQRLMDEDKRRTAAHEKEGQQWQAEQQRLHEAQSESLRLQEQYLQSQRQLLKEYAVLMNRVHAPGWLGKRLIKQIVQWPVRYRQEKQQREQIAQSGLFDPNWYLMHNPDVQSKGLDALTHYQRHGGFEGRDPSPEFSTLNYLMTHPQLMSAHQHPLVHYLQNRQPEVAAAPVPSSAGGALFNQLFSEAAGRSDVYVERSEQALEEPSRVRAIAFYLPQFHPIAENNRWWGTGFTEWTNVGKAVPQFEGHYQPRHPGELGYYDLRLPEVQERQVELAQQHGIEAFCFHYYWFSGRKRLLERPVDQFANNPNIDFPFCLCWANENWTRRWDGQESDVLMEQKHQPQDDQEFIEDIFPLLQKPNYLKVDGKPLLIVYRVDILPDAAKTAQAWREYCREQGVGEIHLVAAQSFGITDPAPYGFDAAVEFPPHGTQARQINREQDFINPDFQGNVYDYNDLVATQLAKPEPEYRLYRTVFPGWDNEARKPGRGHIFHHANPETYRQWLGGACAETDRHPGDDKLVFINAWNEWAEGAYLEPDRHFGYAYLEATKQTLAQFPSGTLASYPPALNALQQAARKHDTAVILHLYHTELWSEVAQYLESLQGNYDLYVSLPEHADADIERTLQDHVPGVCTVRWPNRGRDVAPFLAILKAIEPLGYQQVCKIHAKRSLHRADGDQWRQMFLGELLGSTEQAGRIIDAFKQQPELGMVGPAGHWLPYTRYWGAPLSSPARFNQLKEQLGIHEPTLDALHFFAGSMFWCRPQAMALLLDNAPLNAFDMELGQKDATFAHSLERLFAAACQSAGFRVTDTQAPAASHPPAPVKQYAFAQPSPALSGQQAPNMVITPPGTAQIIERRAKTLYHALKRRLN
ncbi:glycoside hydrolase family 99-like domain-containing protein [Halomonas hibernica]|uniref:glycoside hydrolase family 99-like domain-containing protein n=1 Tax=Halomonas hibernica TaxID=2591147 RepID=UPI0015566454|nr:glycoside hydrolase family 99-like domain-containing protein [Halomonas hibernica]